MSDAHERVFTVALSGLTVALMVNASPSVSSFAVVSISTDVTSTVGSVTVTLPAVTVVSNAFASALTTALKETFVEPALSALNSSVKMFSFVLSNSTPFLRANDA